MGGNTEYIAGHGYLSLGQAVRVAQNSEGGVDQQLAQVLEKRLAEVWAKLNSQPSSYILPPDEFALLNYYRTRFGDNEVHSRDTSSLAKHFSGVLAVYFLLVTCQNHWDKMYNSGLKGSLNLARRYAWMDLAKQRYTTVLFLILMTILHSTLASHAGLLQSGTRIPSLSNRAVANNSSMLQCLQVAPPVLSPAGECQATLMVHTFAFSYGQPFIGIYDPPSCDFNRVTINLTVTSVGRQFDRLALLYFDDVEIFRTSTAEPTANGIIWSYTRDMSAYLALFKSSHKIIFDLGNLIDDTYTGAWNTTLTAAFFTAADDIDAADLILPISARKAANDQASAFIVPETKAVNVLQLPRNANKAVVSISACGQAAEEFWWSNVLSSDTRAFGNETMLYGHSPFRELQVLIDGHLAGVAWPFPVIFTGGIVPGFWRPIVGIDAFDLKEDEIDISPFLPLLSDGSPHTFEIRVIGIDDDGQGDGVLTEKIESNWVVTGKVFLWLHNGTTPAQADPPTILAPPPEFQLLSTRQQGYNGTTTSLQYSVQVSRQLYIESITDSSTGLRTSTWSQNLTFSNSGRLSNNGNDQVMEQKTFGTSKSSSGYVKSFDYPLWVASSYDAPPGGNVTITGKMGRGKNVEQIGELSFPNEWRTFDHDRLPSSHKSTFSGSNTNDWQNGTASYLSVPAQKRSFSWGTTEQIFSLSGITSRSMTMIQTHENGVGRVYPANEDLYQRHIVASNDTVVHDKESYGGQGHFNILGLSSPSSKFPEFAMNSIRVQLGRGPY
ncbi:peptide N-acetyl-beta-D-glucosaminyl asparaginase amidase A-domain-containing protein [Phaeosphaeria sp. MPI-PUGE-AT-0046c]|nr:peptide N-acetyl-beta-D-glucosaminyl asparaginase amidase A-domain-containing protein [Phaeosphaeria sp. MPI-PUGE-AT-0046c]